MSKIICDFCGEDCHYCNKKNSEGRSTGYFITHDNQKACSQCVVQECMECDERCILSVQSPFYNTIRYPKCPTHGGGVDMECAGEDYRKNIILK